MKKLKSAAIILTITFSINSSGQALSFKNIILDNKVIKTALKFTGIGAAALAGSAAIYYTCEKILDIIQPSRQVMRNAKEELNKEMQDAAAKYIDNKNDDNIKTLNDDNIKTLNDNNIKTLMEKINSVEAISNFQRNNNPFSAKSIPIVGGAVAIGSLLVDSIENAGNISKKVLEISCLKYAWDNAQMAKEKIKSYFETPTREFSKEEVFANFDEAFKDIHGQNKALESLKNYIYDIVVGKNQAKWKGEKYNHGDVLYFHGPSGVGKSSVSSAVANILYSNPKVYTVTASDVDKDQKDSVVSQLFGSNRNVNTNVYNSPPEKGNDLINFLKSNPNGIIKIEEYDKICTPALDEVFRTIMEIGIINIGGEKIDCSGMLFILTSNEDKISMEGFDKNLKTQKMDSKHLSQGYTRVWHDKSFLNRIKKVEFINLNSEAYEVILRKHFDKITEYWLDPKNAGIKLIMNDKIIKTLATIVAEMDQGARPIDLEILPSLQIQIGNKIKSAPSLDFYNGKTFDISYDENQKKFDIEVLNLK